MVIECHPGCRPEMLEMQVLPFVPFKTCIEGQAYIIKENNRIELYTNAKPLNDKTVRSASVTNKHANKQTREQASKQTHKNRNQLL